MRGHFLYLRFKTFPMTPKKPQCEVFWALLSSFEHSGVPEDSKSSLFPSVGLHPHTWPKWGCDRKIPLQLSSIHTPGVNLSQSMVGQASNASILADAGTYQGLSTLDIMGYSTTTSPTIGCPTSTPSHTSAFVATTLPRSHNVAFS